MIVMKKMVFMRCAALVFIICNVLFSCSPAHAANLPPPVTVLPPEAPQVQLWQHGAPLVVTPQGAYVTSNPVELGAGSALYDTLRANYTANQNGSPAGGGSATNPDGFKASVNAGGQAMLTAEVPVGVTAPQGAVIAAGGAAAAAGVGVMAKAISLGAPLATTLAKGALIGAGTAGAVFGSPVLMGMMMVASVGISGYQLYQGLKGQGITGNADGSASLLSSSVPVSGIPQWAYSNGGTPLPFQLTPEFACRQIITSFNMQSTDVFVSVDAPLYSSGRPYHSWCYLKRISDNYQSQYALSNWTSTVPVCSSGTLFNALTSKCESSVSSVTNEQMIAALTAATAAASVAADAANFALKNGQSIPAGTPLQSPAPVTVQSGFSEVQQLIDALNNNTSVQRRNIATITPGATSDAPPIVRLSQEERRVVNAVPSSSSVTQLSTPPISFSPVGVVSSSTDKPTPDLCQQHPEILACANLQNVGDVPDDVQLVKKDVNVSITPVSLSSMAICPAPIVISGVGILPTYIISFQPACNQLSIIKPLMLLFAWLTAGMIVFVGRPYQSA